MSGAVLIGPPTPTAGGANLVLSSQPQFTPAPYPPYHTAAHLAATSRPTLIAAHATPPALPPGSAFRPPTAAAYPQMQHNGEILYPYAGGHIAFLTTAGTQNLQQTMRSAAQTTQPPPPQQQQQQQPPLIQQQQQQQKVPTAYTPPAVITGVVPPPPAASTPTGSLYPPQSCFNCGSQKHTGLDCQESSMEDVTRNSIYKLDYNASLAAAAAALSAAGGQPGVAPASSSSSSSPSSLVAVSSTVVVVSPALSASVSMSRMSLVDVTGKGGVTELAEMPHSPSPVHHHSVTASLVAAAATTLPSSLTTPSQQSLAGDVATSVSTQTINNQTDSSSSSTISK